MDVGWQLLKESNKGRFDSHSVMNGVLIISHITFWDCQVHIVSDNLSRKSCIHWCNLCSIEKFYMLFKPDMHGNS